MKLTLSTGKNRHDKAWKNKSVTWPDLLARLQKTHRTHETLSEYMAAKPDRQAEIKDVGGFVGGHIVGGRRKAGSVLERSLITLDLDFATPETWDFFKMIHDGALAACVYSTHKHTPESPRLRLIIPLARPVTAEEYVPLSRRVAEWVGLETVDRTTFQPTRLMYWPSTAKDGEFLFDTTEGPFMDPDAVLSTYSDWRDVSQWPLCPGEEEKTEHEKKKAGDPLEKPGLIGAFCRQYTISEAIEKFLPDIYEPSDVEGRYTFTRGTTSGGAIVFDDLFLYSYHSTDPACERLLNAFDLVRVHLYGLQDEDKPRDTPVYKLPSYDEMTKLCSADAGVRQKIGEDLLKEFAADLVSEADQEDAQPPNMDWLAELEVNKDGEYVSTIGNRVLILKNDPAFAGAFALDLFENKLVLRKDLPWRRITDQTRFLTDADLSYIEHRIEQVYSLKGRDALLKALEIVQNDNAFHSVREYLGGLIWDGKPRLDTLFIDWLNAENTEYVRAVTRKAFTAAVARVYQPGIKFDCVLTLIGTKQGEMKSTMLSKMGRQWFSDSFNVKMMGTKDGQDALNGVWIMEIAELAGMAKAEVEQVKAFISAVKDRYRPAYGRNSVERFRQCVFFATTNKTDFLRDQTGNRRFWPVVIKSKNTERTPFEMTDEIIGQLWAEAVQRYRDGETLYLSEGMEATARGIQELHTESDERMGQVIEYLNRPKPAGFHKLTIADQKSFINGCSFIEDEEAFETQNLTCASEIHHILFGGDTRSFVNSVQRDINGILRKLPGWEEKSKKQRLGCYGPQRVYGRIVAKSSVTVGSVANFSRSGVSDVAD